MQDMINRGLVNISQISLYPDEADEMLNMGFYEDIVNILLRQTKKHMVISATMPAEVAIVNNS
jgi:ATP-dependent RNA helicase DeaD